jgi:hypothetical protein
MKSSRAVSLTSFLTCPFPENLTEQDACCRKSSEACTSYVRELLCRKGNSTRSQAL